MRGRGSPAWITFVSMLPRFPFILEITKVYPSSSSILILTYLSRVTDLVAFRRNPIVIRLSNNETLSFLLERTSLKDASNLPRLPTTRIGVKRIVIEVNRDLTVEQLEILDEALKRAGLVRRRRLLSTIVNLTSLERRGPHIQPGGLATTLNLVLCPPTETSKGFPGPLNSN